MAQTSTFFYTIGLCAALFAGAAGMHHAYAAADAHAVTPPACEISGTVSDISVKKSMIPSAIIENETHISVDVTERKARYGNTMPCPARSAKAETRTYKLCSQNDVQAGDVINGTEASATGPASPMGCLFDLVVVAHKN